MHRLFTDHPASVDETYAEHLGIATAFGTRMILAGLACLIHGLLPFLFVKTGSNTIAELHARMVTHRRRFPEGRLSAHRGLSTGR
ncbi:MAG: hypothetical protein D6826_06560 [Alphaproteobacteria bacterium]|nr:MAG: hypothetical protein D6826_06560 [Alphaproteobacteria bacterium]